MFGKGSSKMNATGKFVMSMGRKSGNLKAGTVAHKSDKPMPVKAAASFKARTVKAQGKMPK